MHNTSNINIRNTMKLTTPSELMLQLPADDVSDNIFTCREDIKAILAKKDKRLLVIAGPCSIHDEKAAMEYAERLAKLREKYIDRIYIVMRVYFEKPRTTIGWKGLINDPYLDGSNNISEGIQKARKILLNINRMGLPVGTEMLDPIVPQYIADLISWSAIGARTTESQTHREMASGLSMPVGFKNSTEGNLQIAVDALQSCKHPHSFLGINTDGQISVVQTKGNPNGHVILRGGRGSTNYDQQSVEEAVAILKNDGLEPLIMVDCSHANSEKVPEKQAVVWKSIVEQRVEGNANLIGLMLESNLVAGNQKLSSNPDDLQYGVSITDACIAWDKTEELFSYAYEQLANVFV